MNQITKTLRVQGIRLAVALAAAAFLFNCTQKKLIQVDGSSTVYPITEAVAEAYRSVSDEVSVVIGVSGTGGGFAKFCVGETDISDASRPIKDSEMEICASNGIEYHVFEVAYDGLAVIVNKENDFVDQLTVDQLNLIFREGGAVNWSDVNPAWPAEEIKIFAPGQDSGTYDYFKEAILGEETNMNPGATFSEDDNVLVLGVAGERYGIGFFGLAYFEENQDTLKLVPVVNPALNRAVIPNMETVSGGTYAPLSRPLFIYVKKSGLDERPEVMAFVRYYLEHAAEKSAEVGYIPLPAEIYQRNLSEL